MKRNNSCLPFNECSRSYNRSAILRKKLSDQEERFDLKSPSRELCKDQFFLNDTIFLNVNFEEVERLSQNIMHPVNYKSQQVNSCGDPNHTVTGILTPDPTPEDDDSDNEANRAWENSIYVPKPAQSNTTTPISASIRKISSPDAAPAAECRSNTSSVVNFDLGISDINWDETLLESDLLNLEPKPKEEFLQTPKSIPFAERFQKQLYENRTNRVFTKPTHLESPSSEAQAGSFYGLSSNVKLLFEKFRGIKDLYDWQKRCLAMPEINSKHNLVYALPTSGGKTLVAEILMLRELLLYNNNVLLILPYVSIVQEKVRAMSQLAVELDFFVEEYAAGKGVYPPRKRRSKNSVYIATIEKALGLVNSLMREDRIHEIGLIIVDELHLLGEGSRGAILENILTKILFLSEKIQIVGMSATIGNLEEIAAFLNANLFTEDFRPVELTEYVKCENCIFTVDRTLINEGLSPLKLEHKILPEEIYDDTKQLQKDPDCISALVKEVIPDNGCLVFCPSRKNCENVAKLICSVLENNYLEIRTEEKKALRRALKAEGNGSICPVLNRTLNCGVAYHHSGLTAAERRLLEEAFLARTICVICCTSTLAAGVNLPARRVILRSPYVGTDFLDVSRYKQMIGRAGRAGFGNAGDSILLCLAKDTDKVIRLLSSSMNETLSCLAIDEAAGLQDLILSCVSLGLAKTREDLRKIVEHSLLRVQADKLGICVNQLIDKCITNLFNEGGLVIQNLCGKDAKEVSDLIYVDIPPVNKNAIASKTHCTLYTEFGLSRLGEAAVKAGVSIEVAHRLNEDLLRAQDSLVLLNYLHLLYIVSPYNMTEQIKPVTQVYFNVFMELGNTDLRVASALGLTEGVMMTLMNKQTTKAVSQKVIDRFYLTLILSDLWHEKSVWQVSSRFQVTRGVIYSLLTAASAFCSSVIRYAEVLEEFWCFKALLEPVSQRLAHCCSMELLPLMELPAVKIGRARQFYNAGYRTLRDIATADPTQIIRKLDHMPRKTAYQIVAAAKLLLLEKATALQDEAAECLEGLCRTMKSATLSPL